MVTRFFDYISCWIFCLIPFFGIAADGGYTVFTSTQLSSPSQDTVTWTPSSNTPHAGMDKTMWVKIKLEKPYRFLVFENAHLDSIQAYFYSGNKLLSTKLTGDRTPFASRDVDFHFLNLLIPDSCTTVYLCIKTEGSAAAPFTLLDSSEITYFFKITRLNWLFLGIMVFAIVVNIVFGLYLRERIHILYCFYVFSLIVIFFVDSGYLFQVLYPNAPWVNHYVPIFYCLFVLSFTFSQKYLGLTKELYFYNYFFYLVYAITAVVAGLNFVDYALAIQLFSYTLLFSPLGIIAISVIFYWKTRNKAVLIFIIGWLLYLLSLVLYTLASFGVFEYNLYWPFMVQLGNLIEVFVLQFGVLYKIGQLKQESLLHKRNMLTLLEEKEKILIEHSNNLESLVEERIDELNRTNLSIKDQNVLLKQQKEELEAQQDKLTAQNNLIEEVNALLRQKHHQLEMQVFERTKELEKANNELKIKNHRLEQFAYMAAHNLRGPVATLLGLGQLAKYELESNGKINEAQYIDGFQKTAEKLDSVIQGLGLILNLEKTMDGLSEATKISHVLHDVEILLQEEIQKSGCKILTDLQVEVVNLIPVYLNNILYNLISNSIKYRSEQQIPSVLLKTYLNESGKTVLEYFDNSIGLDLNKYGEKIFTPFKRFSESTKGIGLGLYMIKVQIEAMGGHIELKSAPGAGMHYNITLEY